MLPTVGTAQNITGSTTINIDPDTGQVTVICETDMDYDAAAYYEPEVTCTVSGNGKFIQRKQGTTPAHGDQQVSDAVIQFAGVPGTTYTAQGTHSGTVLFQDPNNPYPTQPAFYDAYNFGYYLNNFSPEEDTYENSYDWFGPGPPEDYTSESVTAGNTTASASYQNCFAQLKYRAVNIAGFAPGNHSFWWIQDSVGNQYIIDGGPQNAGCTVNCGYLVDWVTEGVAGQYPVGHYPEDNVQAGTWFDSTTSHAVCQQVDNLETAAKNWPQTQTTYWPTGPNSNTFAHQMADAGSFIVTQPPNAIGW